MTRLCRALCGIFCLGVLAVASVPVVADEGPSPIVLVPGLTGAKLRDRDTGKVVWGNGSNLFFPHDGGYGLARPLGDTDSQQLEAFDVIDTLSIGLVVRKKIYGPLLRLFEKNGYQRGRLGEPEKGDSFLTFAYDWRQDVVDSARELAEQLEQLRVARGDESLRVSLICQSGGALICRYFAKYGGASLEEAELDPSSAQRHVSVDHLVLVGTANGGSLRNLLLLERGRNYIPGLGRRGEPESMFTFASLYQDLPCYRRDLFVDLAGQPIDVDLYDAQNWVRYEWSIFGEKARSRVAASGREDIFGDIKTRVEYLERSLDRARRLQRVLRDDASSFDADAYHSIQGAQAPTGERAVLVREGDVWRILFADDDEIGRELRDEIATHGDGHATVSSQQWLSPQEQSALGGKTLYVPGGHFSMIISAEAQAALAEIFEFPDGG